MASSIAAITTGSGGIVSTGDSSGNLNLVSGTTTILALTSAGVSVTGTLTASGAVTLTTVLPVASGGTGVSTSTGTGAVVLGTSPTLATPTFNSAQLATVVGTAPLYMARAWVNFNGQGTVAIRGSANVSSVSDNATGSYTLNFTTAMDDINYSVSGATSLLIGVSDTIFVPNFTPPGTETASTTSSFKFAVVRPSVVVAADVTHVYVSVFR